MLTLADLNHVQLIAYQTYLSFKKDDFDIKLNLDISSELTNALINEGREIHKRLRHV